jgi:hypothetical protein
MRMQSGLRGRAWLRAGRVLLFAALVCGPARGEDIVPGLAEVRDRCRQEQKQLSQAVVAFRFQNIAHGGADLAKRIEAKIPASFTSTNRTAFKGDKKLYEQEFPGRGRGRKYPLKVIRAYDGQATYSYDQEGPIDVKGMATARVETGEYIGTPARDDYIAYHGFPKLRDYKITLDDLKESVSASLTDALDDPGCKVEPALQPSADGTRCVVVTSKRQGIWLDPRLNLALRQREWRGPGERGVVTRIRFADHAEVAPGLWLAKLVLRDYFADLRKAREFAEAPYRTEEIHVTEIKTDPVPDELFSLRPPAGTYVVDLTKFEPDYKTRTQRAVSYTIPADPVNIEDVVRKATEQARASGEPRGTSVTSAFVMINVAALVGIVVFFVWRRAKVSRSF